MIRRMIPTAVGAAVIIALGATTQAVAYPDQGSGSTCSSGSSGAVCAHMETDAGSGHIRARAAATANSGEFITVTLSELDELTTERATGQQTLTVLRPRNGNPETSTGSTVSVIAGPFQEQCDNALAKFQWRAVMNYDTIKGSFTLNSGWQPGRC